MCSRQQSVDHISKGQRVAMLPQVCQHGAIARDGIHRDVGEVFAMLLQKGFRFSKPIRAEALVIDERPGCTRVAQKFPGAFIGRNHALFYQVL